MEIATWRLVQPTECVSDNRGAVVSLTQQGLDCFHRASSPQLKAIKKTFAEAMKPTQIATLAEESIGGASS